MYNVNKTTHFSLGVKMSVEMSMSEQWIKAVWWLCEHIRKEMRSILLYTTRLHSYNTCQGKFYLPCQVDICQNILCKALTTYGSKNMLDKHLHCHSVNVMADWYYSRHQDIFQVMSQYAWLRTICMVHVSGFSYGLRCLKSFFFFSFNFVIP